MIRKIAFALTIFLPFVLFSGCIHGDYLNIEIPDDITIRYSDDHNYDCTYFNPTYSEYSTAKDTITGTITVPCDSVLTVKYGYVAYTEYDSYTKHTNRRDYDFVLVDETGSSYSFSIETYPGEGKYGYDEYCSKDFTLKGDFVANSETAITVSCRFVRTTF